MKKFLFLFLLPFVFLIACDKGDPVKPGPPKPKPDTLLVPAEDTTQFSLEVSISLEYTREVWYCPSVGIYVCQDSSNWHFYEWAKIIYPVNEERRIYDTTAIFGPFYKEEAKRWIGQKLYVYYRAGFLISPQYRKYKYGWIEVEIEEGLNELHLESVSPP